MLPHLARQALVLVVCLSLGMHWALLQGIAWTGMLISFAAEGTVIEAVEKTFNGQNACALCQKVKQGQASDDEQPQQNGQAVKKIDAVLVQTSKLVAPAAGMMFFVHVHEEQVRRSEEPEMPPPRRGLA
ncbi:MAG: hypothetical protein IAE77_22300 [Prosthecobacter sp.]|uniref:hypothetical protein n=1 Tax=Prosthecobacter sp. TaxID=1965333 RepID=UPI0019ECC948|nr:hypothetical protein [Prosthecobacter sp.]MBE2286204.1 hypothetical protein [Prosthecobacter sp.]